MKISVKKIMACLFLAVLAWQFYELATKSRDHRTGKIALLGSFNWIDDAFILENHLDVKLLTRDVLNEFQDPLNRIWKFNPPVIKLLDLADNKPCDDIIDRADTETFPKLYFYYKVVNGFKIIKDIRLNPAFAFSTHCGYLNKEETAKIVEIIGKEELFSAADPEFLRRVIIENSSFVTERNKFTRDMHLAYDQTELDSLSSYAGAASVIALAGMKSMESGFNNIDLLRFDNNLEMREMFQNNLIAFRNMADDINMNWTSAYFWQVHTLFHQQVVWYNLKYKTTILCLLLCLAFLFLQVVRRDAALVVREELYKLGITMNRRMIWRIILSNWRFLILPARDEKMRPIIAKACERVHWQQEDKALRGQAETVWQRCRGLTDHCSLEGEYRIASGRSKGANLEKRRRALVQLLQGEQRLRQRKEKLATLVGADVSQKTVRKEKRTEPAQGNRDRILELVRELIPDGVAVALDGLSVEKLERLARIINMIDGWHPAAVKTLLERNNLGTTLDTKSKLLAAVNAGDRTIALKELGLLEKKVSKPKEIVIAEYDGMLRGISVLIIGGGRTEGKKRELYGAIADLGGADCRVISTDDRRKILDAVESGQELVVFIATDNSHGTRALLDKERVPYLTINKLNRDRFTRELIVQYQKTLSK